MGSLEDIGYILCVSSSSVSRCNRYKPNSINEAGNTAYDIARATGQEFLMRGRGSSSWTWMMIEVSLEGSILKHSIFRREHIKT